MSDRQVPIGFFGAHTDRYSVNNQAVLERELQVMRDAGVETLRVGMDQQRGQPPILEVPEDV